MPFRGRKKRVNNEFVVHFVYAVFNDFCKTRKSSEENRCLWLMGTQHPQLIIVNGCQLRESPHSGWHSRILQLEPKVPQTHKHTHTRMSHISISHSIYCATDLCHFIAWHFRRTTSGRPNDDFGVHKNCTSRNRRPMISLVP